MHKFKVGDKLKYNEDGQEMVITSVMGNNLTSKGFKTCDNWTMDYLVENFTLVEDTPKPKFKVGDRVRMSEKQSTKKKYTCEDTRQGKEGYVIKKISNEEGNMFWCYYGRGLHDWIEQQDLELAEEECKSCPKTATEISLEGQSCEINAHNVKGYMDRAIKVLNQGFIGELGGLN